MPGPGPSQAEHLSKADLLYAFAYLYFFIIFIFFPSPLRCCANVECAIRVINLAWPYWPTAHCLVAIVIETLQITLL